MYRQISVKHYTTEVQNSHKLVEERFNYLFSSIQQQSFAATAAEIEQKYLQDACNALESNNTTGAIRDILAILEWEFNEVHPKIESFLGNVSNVTASG